MGSRVKTREAAIKYGPLLKCPSGHVCGGMGDFHRACPCCDLEKMRNLMIGHAREANELRRLDQAKKEG